MTTTDGAQFQSTEHADRPEESEFPTTHSANQAKVLVVDDFSIVRRVVGRIIRQRLGLSAIEAGNGEEALEIINRAAPTVILTDMQMPRMNGLELVGAVRQKSSCIPVILMTAEGSENLAVQALRAGAAGYVCKKRLEPELASTLERVLTVVAIDKRRERVQNGLEPREAQFKLESDPGQIGPLIGLLLADLAAMELCDPTARIQVGVALLEALRNALYHGNLELGADLRLEDERRPCALVQERRGLAPYRNRHIEVRSQVDRDAARFVIGDEGPGFDTTRFNAPLAAEDLLRFDGRGLLLIRAFMDQVQHNEAGNQITLIKRRQLEAKPGRPVSSA